MTRELTNLLTTLHNDESGATATEYIILLVCVACFVIAAVKLFGNTVSLKFNDAQKGIAEQVTFGN
jgi:Flp pilus assembly pilin Flp